MAMILFMLFREVIIVSMILTSCEEEMNGYCECLLIYAKQRHDNEAKHDKRLLNLHAHLNQTRLERKMISCSEETEGVTYNVLS